MTWEVVCITTTRNEYCTHKGNLWKHLSTLINLDFRTNSGISNTPKNPFRCMGYTLSICSLTSACGVSPRRNKDVLIVKVRACPPFLLSHSSTIPVSQSIFPGFMIPTPVVAPGASGEKSSVSCAIECAEMNVRRDKHEVLFKPLLR